MYARIDVQHSPRCKSLGLCHSLAALLPWDKHEEFAPQIFPGHEVSRRVRRLIRESRKSNTLAVYQPSCIDAIVCIIRARVSEFSVVTVTARITSLPLALATATQHYQRRYIGCVRKRVYNTPRTILNYSISWYRREKKEIICDTDKLFLVVCKKKKKTHTQADIHCCGFGTKKKKEVHLKLLHRREIYVY